MRWSWASFAVGAAVCAALFLVLPRGDHAVDPGPASGAVDEVLMGPTDSAEASITAGTDDPGIYEASNPALEGRTNDDDPPPAGELPSLDWLRSGKPNDPFIKRWNWRNLRAQPVGPGRGALAHTLHQQCRSLAETRLKGTKPVTRERVAGWLRSSHGDSVMAGTVLAMRQDPPLRDELLGIVRDPGFGLLRSIALHELAMHEGAREDAATLAGVTAALGDEDPAMRATAMSVLLGLGERGVELALAELSGRTLVGTERAQLAHVVAASPRVVQHLRGIDDADLLLDVLSRVQPKDEGMRRDLGAAMPGLLGRALEASGADGHASTLVKLLAAVERTDLVGDTLLDGGVRRSLRLALLNRAMGGDLSAEARRDLMARTLSVGDAPADLLLAVLGAASKADLEVRGIAEAAWRLVDDHAHAGVREAARQALQQLEPGDTQGLRIVKATYGKDGKEVDVTALLRRRVVRGRLTITAHNGLAGDPNPGIVKDLVIVYEAAGRRFTRVIREGQRAAIP